MTSVFTGLNSRFSIFVFLLTCLHLNFSGWNVTPCLIAHFSIDARQIVNNNKIVFIPLISLLMKVDDAYFV